MSKRYNHYHIKVDFSISNKECAIGNIYAQYSNGKNNEDSFHFFSKSFTLIASRSKAYVVLLAIVLIANCLKDYFIIIL